MHGFIKMNMMLNVISLPRFDIIEMTNR